MSVVNPRTCDRRSPPKTREKLFCGDRATVGASPETSVINLLFAGSRMSVLRLGAVPVCHRASILRSATSIAPGIPLAMAALPPLHEVNLHRSDAPAQAPCL